MKIKLVLDTNVLMKIGEERILSKIYNLVKQETHVFVLLTCVEKELNKLALTGMKEAIIGLKRLEKLKNFAPYERVDILQVYADDPIVEYCAQAGDITALISGDGDLKRRVYDLKNPNMQIFNLTNRGQILPFDPTYDPEMIRVKENQQVTEKNEKNSLTEIVESVRDLGFRYHKELEGALENIIRKEYNPSIDVLMVVEYLNGETSIYRLEDLKEILFRLKEITAITFDLNKNEYIFYTYSECRQVRYSLDQFKSISLKQGVSESDILMEDMPLFLESLEDYKRRLSRFLCELDDFVSTTSHGDMKKDWKCGFCDALNPDSEYKCRRCSASR